MAILATLHQWDARLLKRLFQQGQRRHSLIQFSKIVSRSGDGYLQVAFPVTAWLLVSPAASAYTAALALAFTIERAVYLILNNGLQRRRPQEIMPSFVLLPILDLPPAPPATAQDHILVYLPFEGQAVVTKWLNGFSEHRFLQYASTLPNDEQGNVGRRTANIAGFKSDLASARGVVCNCGFELISECLHWRKPVLTRPLAKQMEQLFNGAALEALGYATVMRQIDDELAASWLAAPPIAPNLSFPNVSATLASWLAAGAKTLVATLGAALGRQSAAV